MIVARILFASAFAVILLHACESSTEPQNHERIERFETGVISRRVHIVDGKKEGKMTDFYPDGKLMAERWFKNGLQYGRTAVYYPGGQIKEAQYYERGLQQRGDTIWYENGRIAFVVEFENDKKNGYLRKWSPDGAMIYEARYEMDTLVEVKGKKISRPRDPDPLAPAPAGQ